MAENKLPIFFRYRILWHIVFWVLVYLMFSLVYGSYFGFYKIEFVKNLILMPARILGTYLLIYLVLPVALDQKRFGLFAVLVAVHAFLYGLAIWASSYYLNLFPEIFDYSSKPFFRISKIMGKILSDYGVPFLAVVVVVLKRWYLNEQQRAELVKEKLEAELQFLKLQVHPHFLFNTLNNLYALTLIKSEHTPEVVLKLSGLLDYMIYKSNDKFVPLEKELEMLESYIELEKLRYNKRLDFDYQLIGEPGSHQIAPLILLPFVENSFKHGAGNDRTKPKIRIKIEINNDCLTLNVVNSIRGESKKDESLGAGIGLKNVRRRLELIYPDVHQLEIRKSEKEFEVNLEICWGNA